MTAKASGIDPPRPPTPLKHNAGHDGIQEALAFLDTSDKAIAEGSLATPPISSPVNTHPTCEANLHKLPSKKIRFEPHTTDIDEALSDRASPGSELRSNNVASSRARRSTKSILKPVDVNGFASSDREDSDASPPHPTTIPEMLEFAFKELAGGPISSQVDAYRMLLACIKTCADTQDRGLLLQKFPLVEDFIERDLHRGAKDVELGSKGLALQSLKVAAAVFAEDIHLSSSLSNDFMTWLYEDTFALLSSPSPNKERTKNQLILLTYSAFCQRVLNVDRASKILQQLYTITQRVSGTAIQVLRLWIMNKLLEHQQSVMLSNVRQWLPLLFHGLLSSSKELRCQAINLSQRAADSLGAHKVVSVAVAEFLDLKVQGGNANYHLLEKKLQDLLKADNGEAVEVPRIWSSIVMFLRGSRQHLESWKHLRSWLQVIQLCFNSSVERMHVKAFVAWNHLITAVRPGLRTRKAILDHICLPIFRCLQRQGSGLTLHREREAAMSSFRLVLFFAFRPDAVVSQWEAVWKAFIDPAIESVAPKDAAFAAELGRIFHALFSSKEARIWNVSLIRLKSVQPVQLANLPRIDPQWTRRHLRDLLLPSVATLVPWAPGACARQHVEIRARAAHALLREGLGSLMIAASKDVKPSHETSESINITIRFLLDTLKTLKDGHCFFKSENDDVSLTCAWSLVDIATRTLGHECFIHSLRGRGVDTRVDSRIPVVMFLVKAMLEVAISSKCNMEQVTLDVQATLEFCQPGDSTVGLSSWLSSEETQLLKRLSFKKPNPTTVATTAGLEVARARPLASKPTPQRPRHDDSQVDFVPIASSSPSNQPDSQMLTEHQRDTRQRQREEAAIFSDLRSSSPIPVNDAGLVENVRHRLNIADAHGATSEDDRENRPAKAQLQAVIDQDVPSSPPEIPDVEDVQNPSPIAHRQKGSDSASTDFPVMHTSACSQDDQHLARSLSPTRQTQRLLVNAGGDLSNHDHEFGLDGQATGQHQDHQQSLGDEVTAQLAEEADIVAVYPNLRRRESEDRPRAQSEQDHDARHSRRLEAKNAGTKMIERANGVAPVDRDGQAAKLSEPTETPRIEDSFAGPVPSPTRPKGQVEAAPEHEATASRNEHDENSGPELIRAISHSPPRTRAVVQIDVPTSSKSRGKDIVAAAVLNEEPTNSSSSALVPRTSSKRKASSQPMQSSTAKRMRVPDTVNKKNSPQPAPTSSTVLDEPDEGCIVLGQLTADTPTMFDIVRQEAASASGSKRATRTRSESHKQSPTPAAAVNKRRGREAKDSADSSAGQTSSLKRNRSAMTKETFAPSKKRKSTEKTTEKGASGLRRSPRSRSIPIPATQSAIEQAKPNETGSGSVPMENDGFQQPVPETLEPTSAAHDGEKDEQPLSQMDLIFPSAEPSTPSTSRSTPASQPLSPSSTARLARSVSSKLRDLFKDVKRLFMGNAEAERERQELEDAYDALGQEVRAAGRRKQ